MAKILNKNFEDSKLPQSKITGEEVNMPEILLGYFIGPFGAVLSSGIFTSILQNYFTDVLRLNLGFLTGLQLMSTIFIIAANLIVGQLIERTKCMAGKARPWILLSAFTISVSSVLMFVVPFQGTMKYIWIAVAYNLFYSVAYPIYSTANSVLVSVSTRNSQKRGTLAAAGNIAGLGAMGIGSMAFPMLVSFSLKENQYKWFCTMAVVAVFSAFTIYLQYCYTRERVTEELFKTAKDSDLEKERISVKKQIKAAAGEKMWWLVMVFYLLFQWSGAMKNGSMSYFCKWVLDNTFLGTADAWGASQSILSIMGAVPMAMAAVVVIPLCNKFGKRNVCAAGMIFGGIGGVIALLGKDQMIPVAVGVALKCLGSSPVCYMILAMLSDVIDYIEKKNSIRTDGFTMSIYSSIAVAGTPVCNAVFSALLNWAGYDQTADIAMGAAAQNTGVRSVISVSYIGAETAAYFICAILIFCFTVEKKLKEEQHS